MAIYHCSTKPVTRASGRSAVAAAAYRSGAKLVNERDGLTHDFTRRAGIEHSEIVIPTASNAHWALDRSALWNAVEAAEKRKDARVAREFEIALPHELTPDQRLELTRTFARDLADRYGVAVDFAIHSPHGDSDIRNHHAHILMTTRTVSAAGLGEKTNIERANKELLALNLPTSQMQIVDIRRAWERYANEALARAGFEERIDHRSHQERGLEIEPTQHAGVHATQMERRGISVERTRIDPDTARRNADVIRERPEQVLSIIADGKSVFDRHDIARALHRYIHDDVDAFQNALAKVMASPELVQLRGEGPKGELARYSTREMVELERAMANSADRLAEARTHGVDRRHVMQSIERQNDAIRAAVAKDTAAKVARGELDENSRRQQIAGARLSDEQRTAIEHITGSQRIAAVVGFAGAGKSTMLAAAREAWEAQGYRVHGAALAGKAAEGLEESSGIQSRTLASWEMAWKNDRGQIGRGDVFVIDEAGMIGSRQLARFVSEVEKAGAKIVLVGDHEQLQAIGAGAAFRAIAERTGYVELAEVRRQREGWQRQASVSFATHRTAEGLAAYEQQGAVQLSDSRDDARADIVKDYLADRTDRPEGSRVVLAHRRADVRALNAEIRTALQERGELPRGNGGGELTYQTNDGKRAFAAGDRIVFLENNRELGVKNGMLGTVERVEGGRIVAKLDGKNERVSIPTADYQAFDHGYATTIHKSQGSTVDRAYVLASGTMDRHLTYVAMTRHRDSVQLYAGRDEFKDMQALSARLGRDGSKETTLDYADFAERRGIETEPENRQQHRYTERTEQNDRQRAEAQRGPNRMAQGAGEGRGQAPTHEERKGELDRLTDAAEARHRKEERARDQFSGEKIAQRSQEVERQHQSAVKAAGEATSRWQADIRASEAHHQQTVRAAEQAQRAAPPVLDRKAEYLKQQGERAAPPVLDRKAEFLKRQQERSADRAIDRKGQYEANKSDLEKPQQRQEEERNRPAPRRDMGWDR